MFRGVDPLIAPERFSQVEGHVNDAGTDLILAFWEAVGLTFTLFGSTFHIAVDHSSGSGRDADVGSLLGSGASGGERPRSP